MWRTRRFYRTCLYVGGVLVLLQTGPCGLVDNQTIATNIVWPQIASVVSDIVFFFLDNAFVHLTT